MSSGYHIEWGPKAERQFKKLAKTISSKETKHLKTEIDSLQDNPRPKGARKVKRDKEKRAWKYTVGNYRVTYDIFDSHSEIYILTVTTREGSYKGDVRTEKDRKFAMGKKK